MNAPQHEDASALDDDRVDSAPANGLYEKHACDSGAAEKHPSNFITHQAPRVTCKICHFMELIHDVNPNVPELWKYEDYCHLRRPCPLTQYLSLF